MSSRLINALIVKILQLILICILFQGCSSFSVAKPENTSEPQATASAPSVSDTAVPEETPAAAESCYCRDFRYSRMYSAWDNSVTETDDTIYLLYDNTVYFSDKEYKDWLPLCSKPECTHKGSDCSAHIESNYITVYGNYIYYIQSKAKAGSEAASAMLCRMRLDGSAHENVCLLPEPEFDFTPYRCKWTLIFTNKYLLVTYDASKDEQWAVSDAASYVFDLETLQATPSDYFNVPLKGEGSKLYSFGAAGEASDYYLTVFDCETGKLERIGDMEGAFNSSWMYGSFDVFDGRFMYYVQDADTEIASLYSMDLSTGENTFICKENIHYLKWSAFDYTNHLLFGSYFQLWPDYKEITRPDWGFYVFDPKLDMIDCFPYSDLAESDIPTPIIQTDGFIFGFTGNASNINKPPVWYIDKNDIGTGNMQWRKWEP